jgi:hypothetical protein
MNEPDQSIIDRRKLLAQRGPSTHESHLESGGNPESQQTLERRALNLHQPCFAWGAANRKARPAGRCGASAKGRNIAGARPMEIRRNGLIWPIIIAKGLDHGINHALCPLARF